MPLLLVWLYSNPRLAERTVPRAAGHSPALGGARGGGGGGVRDPAVGWTSVMTICAEALNYVNFLCNWCKKTAK